MRWNFELDAKLPLKIHEVNAVSFFLQPSL